MPTLVFFATALLLATSLRAQQPGALPRALPTSLADTTFWRISSTFSEPGGTFPADNWTSNETNFPATVASLLKRGVIGGAYLGVGPEQNFHYIVALRPHIAFQLDIRRQAIIQHLMYKAIFELSEDRAAFISLLFCKPRPAGLTARSTIQEIWDAYWFVDTDTSVFRTNVGRLKDHLTRTHKFPISDADLASLTYVYQTFYHWGPSISYNGGVAMVTGLPTPTTATFATLTNGVDINGIPRSFLATEENFGFMKEMHAKNLIVPVVGDFAGDKAIVAVAKFLREHGTTVNAFYTSNVEGYLFRNGVQQHFHTNATALPVDANSVLIRPPQICPMKRFLEAAAIGQVTNASSCGSQP